MQCGFIHGSGIRKKENMNVVSVGGIGIKKCRKAANDFEQRNRI